MYGPIASKIWTVDHKHLDNSEISSAWKGGSQENIYLCHTTLHLEHVCGAVFYTVIPPAASRQPGGTSLTTATHYTVSGYNFTSLLLIY